MAKNPVALQLYTVRDDMANDFAGTLKKVAGIGYRAVEFAGTYGKSAAEIKTITDDLGLAVMGCHVGIDELENRLDAALDYWAALGAKFVTCPWLPQERRENAEGYRQFAASLSRAGAGSKARGIQLCYHNHAFEFEKFDGEYGFDILFGAADSKAVKAELDTYWVEYGGESAVAYIRKYAGRVPILHLKDMANDEKRSFAEIGEGRIDWNAVIAAGEAAGAEWYVVEQDTCQRPPMESAALSFRNLQGKL